jgi:hypothetical protein
MAVTPEYGFVMPDPTDFVTDLPADFEIFGDAVDAQLKALNPGTTAGDVDYYTSSTAKARLGIGTAGQVLAVNSGATAPQWITPASGSLTLISTTTLTGNSVNLTSISGIYKELFVVIDAFSFAGSDALGIRFNNNSTSNNYIYAANRQVGATNATFGAQDTQVAVTGIGQFLLNTTTTNHCVLRIPNYATTTSFKVGTFVATCEGEDAGTPNAITQGGFAFNVSSAITEINVRAAAATGFDNGTVYLYGVL